jgi:hypothetical protein
MPLSNVLIYNAMRRRVPSGRSSGRGADLERRQNKFTICRHRIPNGFLYNKLYMRKPFMTIGKIRLRFLLGIDGPWEVLIKFT